MKYETPLHQHLRLDVHPRCRPLISDPSIPLWITEGMKKVDSLVSRGLCVVGVAGVSAWAGTNEYGGKTALSDWRDIALNDRMTYIVYDSDIMDKKEVHRELSGLKDYLTYKGAKVRIVHLPQLPGLDKVGVDNYLAHGHTVDDVVQHASSELKASPNDEETGGDIPQSRCAEMLTDEYVKTLLFAPGRATWFSYGTETPGIWAPIEDEQMYNRLRQDLGNLKQKGFSWTFLQGCERMLRAALSKPLDRIPSHLIPFQNGVLDITTMGMLPHTPDRFNTWCLPYAYDPLATCAPVQAWLKESLGGDDELVGVIQAYLRAIITGRTSIQKFLELLGHGGTGKSTLINIAVALVGESNTAVTELKHLESSRFEAAKLAGKRLIIITDADRYGGQVATLKAFIGQDQVRWEEKNNRRLGHFVADGMVILAANEAVQSADYTSGLERRRLTVLFDELVKRSRPLIEFDKGDIIGEFAPLIPGIVNWALSMSEQEMVDILVHRSNSIPGLLKAKIRRLRETNPLADWADESLIYDPSPNVKVNVGKKIPLEHMTGYQNAYKWLYPSYLTYMDQTSHNHVAIQRFKGLLDDLCRAQLKLDGVRHHRDASGSHFTGLKFRGSGDTDSPLFIESALMPTGSGEMADNDKGMTGQPIDNDEVYKDDIVCNLPIEKEKEEEKPSFPSSSFAAIGKELEGESSSSPTSPSLATTYSHTSLPPVVMSVIGAQLPIGGDRTVCPKCGSQRIEWGLVSGICQECKFVIEDEALL